MTNRQNAAQAVGDNRAANASRLAAEIYAAKVKAGVRLYSGGVTKKQVRGKKGTKAEFWRYVDKRSDTEWIWTGRVNNNHNTVDTANYDYGVFSLEGCDSELAHRIMVYLTYGRELTRAYEVFHFDGNHLNIHPNNLGVRNVKTRHEQSAAEFFAVANDNAPAKQVAA